MMEFISIGFGVQSSTMALMAKHGEITPMPDGAIFADTQAEPSEVYRWADWLEKLLPFPIYRATKGNMEAEMLILHERVKTKGKPWAKSLIPAYLKNKDGSRGILGRQCSASYKIDEIEKKAKELAGIKRGEKSVQVIQWIGISLDEAHRMKQARVPWSQNRWPLIEARMTRQDCLMWMKRHGYPRPPRSACIFCPYHSNAEWEKMKATAPLEFQQAVEFEARFQEVKLKTDNIEGIPFLHNSLKPLSEAIFNVPSHYGQIDMFGNECEGICGT